MQQYVHTHNWNGQGMCSCTIIYKYYPAKGIPPWLLNAHINGTEFIAIGWKLLATVIRKIQFIKTFESSDNFL